MRPRYFELEEVKKKLDSVLKNLNEKKIGIRKAAELLGVSVPTLIEYIRDRKSIDKETI